MSEYIAQYEKIEEIKTKINNLEDKKNRLYAENSSSKEAVKNDAELQTAKDEQSDSSHCSLGGRYAQIQHTSKAPCAI